MESEFESQYVQEFPFLLNVQTDSGAYLASYAMGTGGISLGVKQPKTEAEHPLSTSAEVKKTGIYTFTPPYVFKV
jgi:hypothetical protein